ncbi:hypothetical protein Acr_11g0009760 [Actinidia rufa]|uniref:Uncharacterized protein n=1 Tax=Actinidia rufa TaxID=165716 RepID=A0A7J0FD87_9ERIC|nr:hypothetical protein Acr_11g0009760 [Actinidia rufa]
MVRTKHAVNDPRGGSNPIEPEVVFNWRWFKNLTIQATWETEFKKRPVLTGRDFEKSFLRNYTTQMLAPMDALGWTNF